MASGDLGGLTDRDWNRLQAIISAFETAWVRGERPRIVDHIPDGERHREALLVELVHAELEFRIKAGESARVEDYLRRHPSLARDRSTVLGLIKAEWSLRRRREPALAADRFEARFPDYRDEVAALSPGEASTVVAPNRSGRAGPRPVALAVAEGPLPRRLGKFELRQRVGAGSFGVVYRAWDTVLGREVAVKVPRPEAMAAPSDVRAFLREARNAIDLRHPHIVAIHDAGPIEGTVCLVRAFVEGQTLADRLKEAAFAPEEAAALMLTVAEALGHAHGRGIIHRDLKPSNILLDREGRPHVSDFGLAKREAGDTTLSPSGPIGRMIGTPAYMSPEQARGEGHLVDARSDVYSAGVVLYEMLTGSIPFRGRGRMLQVQIEEAEPTPPRALNEEVPRDLETICLRAMAKAPAGRYPSAQAMADDLRNFLEGRPVGPRPVAEPKPAYSARNGRLLVASVVLLAAGLVGVARLWAVADHRRREHASDLLGAVAILEELPGLGESPARHGPGPHPRRPLDAIRVRSAALLGSIDPGGDPALRDGLARALARLADRESDMGSGQAAAKLWADALRLAEASALDRPGDPAAREALARSLAGLARAQVRLGLRAESASRFDRALGLLGESAVELRRLAAGRPDDLGAQLDSAEADVELARLGLDAGREADLGDAERVADRLGQAPPAGPWTRGRLARLDLAIARWQLDAGQPAPARMAASRGIRLLEDRPDGPGAGADLARLLLARASACREAGRDREALESLERAADRLESLAGDDPVAVALRRDLAGAHAGIGRLLVAQPGRLDEAIDAHRRALGLRLAIRRDYPESQADLAELAEARADLASALAARGRPAAAAESYLLAIADDLGALALAPGVEGHRRALARHARALARLIRAAPVEP